MRGLSGPITRVVGFDSSLALEAADSCALSFSLAHPVSPRLAERAAAARTDDAATIIYTSGTTGDPKGVVLTFENLTVQFEALERFFSVTGRDRSLCFLPLSHVFERTWTSTFSSKGATTTTWRTQGRSGDGGGAAHGHDQRASALREDLLGRSTRRTRQRAAAALFEWALRTELEYTEQRGETVAGPRCRPPRVADALVLRKIRDVVGGPKNFFAAGGAALAEEIEEFFFAAGLLVCQGYGLTETSPM